MSVFLQTEIGRIISTFLISMLPIAELRAGLPYGIAIGLDYPQALCAAVLWNMVPVPFIIVYMRRIFRWLRQISPWCERIVSSLECRAQLKGKTVQKYSVIGLCALVAIPLPGKGAWTGALVAGILDIRLKRAVPGIFLGVCIAAVIMTAITFGLIHIF